MCRASSLSQLCCGCQWCPAVTRAPRTVTWWTEVGNDCNSSGDTRLRLKGTQLVCKCASSWGLMAVHKFRLHQGCCLCTARRGTSAVQRQVLSVPRCALLQCLTLYTCLPEFIIRSCC
jgi:hypothetical protein